MQGACCLKGWGGVIQNWEEFLCPEAALSRIHQAQHGSSGFDSTHRSMASQVSLGSGRPPSAIPYCDQSSFLSKDLWPCRHLRQAASPSIAVQHCARSCPRFQSCPDGSATLFRALSIWQLRQGHHRKSDCRRGFDCVSERVLVRVCGLPLDLCLLPSLGRPLLRSGAEIRRLRPTPSGVYSLRSRWISDEDDPLTVSRSARTGLAIAVAIAPVTPALAQTSLPQGGSVAAGQATIGSPAGGHLTVTQGSQRAVINWNSFSIGNQNSVTFVQPNAGAAVLNGSQATYLRRLRDGCRQWPSLLVNPNGIAITSTGTVDVSGFVASALNINDDDFMAGRLSFSGHGASGAVTNAGRITAGRGGFAALLGSSVTNAGTITVPLGRVGLGAGEQATLDLEGDGFLQVGIPSRAPGDGPAIEHSGQISADGGRVEIKAATRA